MHLYSLSSHPNKPCNVITFKACTLMLDCGLDMSSVMHFLPLPLVPSNRLNSLYSWTPRDADSHLEGELRECGNRIFVDSPPEFKPPTPGLVDFSEVDVILISNYFTMLALPFITNGTNFKGIVLMTEPTLQLGRLLMEEMVSYIEKTPKAKHAFKWKNFLRSLPSPLFDSKSPKTWQSIYSKKSITEAISHVKLIAYNQKSSICGSLEVTSISSGFCLGSCNWIISSAHEKISYMSGSSSLTTHPRTMDKAALKGSDVMIMTGLNQFPLTSADDSLGDLCLTVARTVGNGGCALLPCYPTGVVYDLFECLSSHLDTVNLSTIPIFFISPVADSSLAYSNIFSEWLSPNKQGKVFQMEDPFNHSNLVKQNRLKAFKNIYCSEFSTEYRQPCIVFCGHPSLRFGDAVHFMEMWGNSNLNCVVFTEPDFDFVDALAPYQPLSIRPFHCPIDTSLSYSQARKLIAEMEVKPGKILVPEVYLIPTITKEKKEVFLEFDDLQPITFGENDIVNIDLSRQYENAEVQSDLAMSLNPVNIKPGVNACTFTSEVSVKDNKYELSMTDGGKITKELIPKSYPYGTIIVDDLIKKLAHAGFTDSKVEEDASGCIITLDNESVMIQLKENSTHIITSNSKIRLKLKEILLECLNSF